MRSLEQEEEEEETKINLTSQIQKSISSHLRDKRSTYFVIIMVAFIQGDKKIFHFFFFLHSIEINFDLYIFLKFYE